MTDTPLRFHPSALKPSYIRDIKTAEVARMEHRDDEGIMPVLHRVKSEFLEMPGLRLTPAQAARLWGMDRHTSERILDGLAMAGFLLKNRAGAYLRASGA